MRRAALLVALAGCGFHIPGGVAPGDDDAQPPTPDATDTPGDVPDDVPDGPEPDAPSVARQKVITVLGTHVDATLANFPVWIELVNDADLAASARQDGRDIGFRSGNADLAYELVSWDKTTGTLRAWVRVPALAAGMDTTFELYFGQMQLSPASDAATTFSSFGAVWHLDDATYADARDLHDGTATGGLGANAIVEARLRRGVDFTVNAQAIEFTNFLTGGGPSTISAWVSQRTATGFDAIVVVGEPDANEARWLYGVYTGGSIACGLYSDDHAPSNVDIAGDGFTLIHWVYNNGVSRLYRDGMQVGGQRNHAANANTQGTDGWIGYAPTGWGSTNGMNGIIDEVRISTVARSAAWIAAEHENQRTGSTFYTVGAAQPVP